MDWLLLFWVIDPMCEPWWRWRRLLMDDDVEGQWLIIIDERTVIINEETVIEVIEENDLTNDIQLWTIETNEEINDSNEVCVCSNCGVVESHYYCNGKPMMKPSSGSMANDDESGRKFWMIQCECLNERLDSMQWK